MSPYNATRRRLYTRPRIGKARVRFDKQSQTVIVTFSFLGQHYVLFSNPSTPWRYSIGDSENSFPAFLPGHILHNVCHPDENHGVLDILAPFKSARLLSRSICASPQEVLSPQEYQKIARPE